VLYVVLFLFFVFLGFVLVYIAFRCCSLLFSFDLFCLVVYVLCFLFCFFLDCVGNLSVLLGFHLGCVMVAWLFWLALCWCWLAFVCVVFWFVF
jgi:hypothetical protein